MPKSRIRRTSAYTPPPTERHAVKLGSPPWMAPLMVALFVVGLVWIVVYYVTQTEYPIGALHQWNMAVGFAFIIAGFGVSTQWK